MFGRMKTKNRRQAALDAAEEKMKIAASYQNGPFRDLKMNIRTHSLLSPILKKHEVSIVGLTEDSISFYCADQPSKGGVIRGDMIYKDCPLGAAVYCVDAIESVDAGVFKTRALLLPRATEALDNTIGQGTISRLSFMLDSGSCIT